MAHILVAEDDEMINELVVRNLEAVGHTCVQVYDGAAVLEHLNAGEAIDLLILDVMMPKMSGFEVIEAIGQETPAIFLTAKGGVMNKVKGLSLGAEDYIVKPFEMLELIARVDVVLRRRQPKREVFTPAGVTVDLGTQQVRRGSHPISLTPQEYQLLETLIRNRNIALSREKLLDLAWGIDFYGDTRTVDVHIQKLRKKLDWTDHIKTVYKMGYRLETGS